MSPIRLKQSESCNLEGVNPAGERCLLCGSNAAVFYECHAVCESSYVEEKLVR